MPPVIGALLWACTAASLVVGAYLMVFRLQRMRLSASMFTLVGIGGALIAHFVAAVAVTANPI
jgi:hypothetical protein